VRDNAIAPVTAGLAVGIALIVLLGSIFAPERPFLLYRTMVEDTTFTIPYRFSDETQDRIVNMTINQDGIILLNVVVPNGSLLEFSLPNKLLNQLEASNRNLSMDELTVFVDDGTTRSGLAIHQ
jgi:hypothetical protein